MQWAAAHSAPAPAQAAISSNTAMAADATKPHVARAASTSGSTSSAIPEAQAVLGYRDSAAGSSITSRSNAGVISVASPPVPDTTDKDDASDAEPKTEEMSSKHSKQFNWNKVSGAVATLDSFRL